MTEPDAGRTGPSPDALQRGASDTPATAWARWEAELATRLRSLGDGESLTIASGPGLERPVLVRRGFLRGFVPARHAELAPWVRLTRVEDHVRGTCVGSVWFGGPFPFSPEEDELLVAAGWRRPGSGDGTDYLRFWPDDVAQGPFLPADEAQRVAAMVARTFREVLMRPGQRARPRGAEPREADQLALPLLTLDARQSPASLAPAPGATPAPSAGSSPAPSPGRAPRRGLGGQPR